MEALKQFVEKFCNFELENIHKMGRKYYQADPLLWNYSKDIKRDLFHIGLFLGETKKAFIPSLALLEIISKKSQKKVFLNERGEWLFTCKRDVFQENITKSNIQNGLCLVQNEKDENVGYGVLQHGGKHMLKPLLDKGDFLRREG